MLYQETFQSGENPSEINVSSCIYINGIRRGSDIRIGYPDHCHSFFELEYIMKGIGETHFNGSVMKTSDRCLLIRPPLSVHGSVGTDKSVNMILQFGYRFLSANAATLPKNAMLVPAGPRKEHGVVIVEKRSYLERCLLEIAAISPSFITPVNLDKRSIDYTPDYELKLNALTLRLIVLLLDLGYLMLENSAGNISEVAQIQAVLNRLITRPEEKFNMGEAARMACMSYSGFSRSFTRIIGRSFVDYSNDMRVHRAEELLKSTNLSITEISHKLGFGSASYFNRIFKNYNGQTPTQYKNNRQRKQI